MVKKVTYAKLIMLYLNDYSRRYYLGELAGLLKKPHQTIKPYVEKLSEDGILLRNEKKGIIEYSLNFKNNKVNDYIVIAEKERVMERLKEDTLLNALYEKLSPYFTKNTFIIFGSAVDNASKGQDIDILIIGRQNASKVVKDFEEVYNKKIHKIQVADLTKISLTLIKEIYKKHLMFNNTEQIIRFFGEFYGQNKLV